MTTIGKIEQLTEVFRAKDCHCSLLSSCVCPKVLGIIQARSTSKRLPGKIFKKIGDKTVLDWCIFNCLKSKVDQWMIAMPHNDFYEGNYWQTHYVATPNVKENDVLGRFARVAEEFPEYEWIVRITADCPFVDPTIIDDAVEYATRTGRFITDQYNEGSTVQVFSRKDLLRADKEIKGKLREHCMEAVRKGWKKGSIDTMADLRRARREYEARTS